jgi:hypothetical protein
MGDKYKQFCIVFFTHEPSSYQYFQILASSHANPSSNALSCQVHALTMMHKSPTSKLDKIPIATFLPPLEVESTTHSFGQYYKAMQTT